MLIKQLKKKLKLGYLTVNMIVKSLSSKILLKIMKDGTGVLLSMDRKKVLVDIYSKKM